MQKLIGVCSVVMLILGVGCSKDSKTTIIKKQRSTFLLVTHEQIISEAAAKDHCEKICNRETGYWNGYFTSKNPFQDVSGGVCECIRARDPFPGQAPLTVGLTESQIEGTYGSIKKISDSMQRFGLFLDASASAGEGGAGGSTSSTAGGGRATASASSGSASATAGNASSAAGSAAGGGASSRSQAGSSFATSANSDGTTESDSSIEGMSSSSDYKGKVGASQSASESPSSKTVSGEADSVSADAASFTSEEAFDTFERRKNTAAISGSETSQFAGQKGAVSRSSESTNSQGSAFSGERD